MLIRPVTPSEANGIARVLLKRHAVRIGRDPARYSTHSLCPVRPSSSNSTVGARSGPWPLAYDEVVVSSMARSRDATGHVLANRSGHAGLPQRMQPGRRIRHWPRPNPRLQHLQRPQQRTAGLCEHPAARVIVHGVDRPRQLQRQRDHASVAGTALQRLHRLSHSWLEQTVHGAQWRSLGHDGQPRRCPAADPPPPQGGERCRRDPERPWASAEKLGPAGRRL